MRKESLPSYNCQTKCHSCYQLPNLILGISISFQWSYLVPTTTSGAGVIFFLSQWLMIHAYQAQFNLLNKWFNTSYSLIHVHSSIQVLMYSLSVTVLSKISQWGFIDEKSLVFLMKMFDLNIVKLISSTSSPV